MRTFVRMGLFLGAGLLATAAVARAAGSAAPAKGESRALRTIVHRLQRHYRSTESFEAKFTEQITSVGGARRNRSGTITYHKPGRMRWDFAPPERETIVSDGTTLYIYEPDLDQVIETPLKEAFRSSAPSALLLGMGNLERDFVASLPAKAPDDGMVHLALAPKADGTRVELALDPDTYDVTALKVTDQLGNVTALQFNAIRTNIALDEAQFRFTPPAGADIVTAPGPR